MCAFARATRWPFTRRTVEGKVSVRLQRTPLSVEKAYRELSGPGLGGVVVFAGRVRPDRTSGGRVEALEYEAHEPVALAALRRLAAKGTRKVPGSRVLLWHRLGRLRVGVPSVIVGAAAPHRASAFQLARWLIDRLKVEVPIWKTARVRRAHRQRKPPAPRGEP